MYNFMAQVLVLEVTQSQLLVRFILSTTTRNKQHTYVLFVYDNRRYILF